MLRGKSGTGKTTFLNLMAGILAPESGFIRLAGRELANPGEAPRDQLRAGTVGPIFQTFNLFQGHTVRRRALRVLPFAPAWSLQ